MSRTVGLGAWLAGLAPDELLAVLRARPDAALRPEPRNVGELAAKLSTPQSVVQAAARLSLPALQVAEALSALGRTATRDDLLALCGSQDAAEAARLDRALDELGGLALAWPVGESVRLSGGWNLVFDAPLALGRPAQELFGRLTAAQLGRIGAELGIGGARGKDAQVRAVAEAVADPSSVARRLAAAGPQVAQAVQLLAWQGPRAAGVHLPSTIGGAAPGDLGAVLALQGWAVPTQWGVGEMPREVALAVRGPGYHAPFDAEPSTLATAPVDPGQLRDAGVQAAGAAVESVRQLIGLIDRMAPPTLQAGGVGVRELRRLAKALGTDEAAVRLWLGVAAAAGLVTTRAEQVMATTAADGWLDGDPAAALTALLLAWWQLPFVPGHQLDHTGKPEPALVRWHDRGEHTRLRADVLRELEHAGAGRGLVEPGALAAVLAFRRPRCYGDDGAPVRIAATLTEAELLGIAAGGALTPLGSDLLAALRSGGPAAALSAATAGLLPSPTDTATFLPDLTVVVAGAAAAELARLLDATAEVESRDTASTWRFTPASVRRALDAGRTADGLLAELAAVADNPLPQPLEYLVRDVSRRHGQLQVFAMASCVRVADPALGAEVAAHRALAALELRVLSDTVLSSAKPIAETVAALRKAGYAPVRQDGRGETVVERVPVKRAKSAGSRSRPPVAAPPDLAGLAARLTGEAAPLAPESLAPQDVPLLAPSGVAALERALAHARPVSIDYVDESGCFGTAVVVPRMALFGTLVATCQQTRTERSFALEGLQAVNEEG